MLADSTAVADAKEFLVHLGKELVNDESQIPAQKRQALCEHCIPLIRKRGGTFLREESFFRRGLGKSLWDQQDFTEALQAYREIQWENQDEQKLEVVVAQLDMAEIQIER